jgi:ParB family chromosome partitioning protein
MTKEFQIVPISQIIESRTNPRRNFRAMDELTASVKKHGVLVPLLVRPGTVKGPMLDGYEIIAGARRYRAAKAAGLQELPVRVKDLGDTEALELQVIENLQREDVHPLEEALGYQALLERPGYDVAAIAGKVGKSESYVYQRLKLADLVKPAQNAFFEDRITAGHAILIARLQPKDQEKALKACFADQQGFELEDDDEIKPDDELRGVRFLSVWIQENIHLDLHAAPFSKTDPNLVGPDATSPAPGPCTTCPKRTGFLPQLFPDIAKKDTCTDRECYQLKIQAHIAVKKAELEKKGKPLIEVTSEWSSDRKGGPESPLPRNKYHEIRDKNDRCESAKKAIVVSGYRDRGKILDICSDPECKKHHQFSNHQASAKEQARQKAEEEKRRRQEQIRKQLLEEILSRAPKTLTRDEWELVAEAFIRRMDAVDAKRVCARHKWEPAKGQYGYQDSREGIRARVSKLTTAELSNLFVELALVGELTVSSWSKIEKSVALTGTAKSYGIDVAAVEKRIDAELAAKKKAKAAKSKKAEPETKRAKSETKAAKKPTTAKKELPGWSASSGRGRAAPRRLF